MERRILSYLPDGKTAELYTLTSPAARVCITDLGATLVNVYLPDRDGVWEDVVLGFDMVKEYLRQPGNLGALVGRYAGRIAGGSFPLHGNTIRLEKNRGEHTIHGGPEGFHRLLWQVVRHEEQCLELELISPDGDQGFPGTLRVRAIYTLEGDTLTLETRAVSDKDTVCSLACHAYWNLSGHASGPVDRQKLSVEAEQYLETDGETIPTGRFLEVHQTAMDLRTAVPLGQRPELDHTYLLQAGKTAAYAEDPDSGRWMKVTTDLPAMQVYTGDHLPEALPGKEGAYYGPRSGFCLEAQHCPDAPNHPNFPSPVLLAGEEVRHQTRWQFGVIP